MPARFHMISGVGSIASCWNKARFGLGLDVGQIWTCYGLVVISIYPCI